MKSNDFEISYTIFLGVGPLVNIASHGSVFSMPGSSYIDRNPPKN